METGGCGGVVRLHVGGLGECVGKDDLLKIFSPMGSVDSVEFVRTKGRSFAYIDFSPSSTNSLTKLFSTYNGCVWKGGRLRLEKAKEHYMARLKREWEETSVSNETVPESRETNLTPSTTLSIFFPRLRKVKALPLSGTGKHKYSFQRVPVTSSLPKSFCDCEEHSTSLTPRETHVHDMEELNGGINEAEVHIMNSVMNKLFQKNNIPNTEKLPQEDSAEQLPEEDSVEQVPEEDSEIETDQDNLIINVASSRIDMMNLELDILSRKRKSISNETTASEGRKVDVNHPSKKRQSILEESEKQEPAQAKREKKKPSGMDLDKSADKPSRTTGVKPSSEDVSWSQKSSWKALVANGNSSNFSVSSFLPDDCSSKEVQPASCYTDLAELPESLKELDMPNSIGRPTKIKKVKSKRLTSTTMTANSPMSEDLEKNDTSAVGSGYPEILADTVAEASVEADPQNLVASNEDDSGNDKMSVESDENDILSVESDENDILSVESDGNDNLSVESDGNDILSVESDENEKLSVESDGNDELSVESDGNDEMGVESDVHDEMGVESDVHDKLSVESEGNVAEDLNAEKESLVLKNNVDHDKEATEEALKTSNKSVGGSSWLQRASWTQLVSAENASFSITQLCPDLNSEKCEAAASVNNNEAGQYSNSNQSESELKQQSNNTWNNTWSKGGLEATGVLVDSTAANRPRLEENRQSLNVKHASARKIIRRKIGSGDTCTFMRSSASLREWAKAKKALSEPRRRKKSEEE